MKRNWHISALFILAVVVSACSRAATPTPSSSSAAVAPTSTAVPVPTDTQPPAATNTAVSPT
ncbi:MAG: hypothetical protein ACE5FD_11315 [Anaerolineae bacterium]